VDGGEGADRCGAGGVHPGCVDALDDLVKALGMTGISSSRVGRLCAEIDAKLKAFLDRPLEGDWLYLWIDAIYVKVRSPGRVVSVAVTSPSVSTPMAGARCWGAALDNRLPDRSSRVASSPAPTGPGRRFGPAGACPVAIHGCPRTSKMI
jgi:hypothetical protein